MSAGTIRASLIRIRRAVAARTFINLLFSPVQKHKQARVVRIIRVVHERVQQIRCRNRRAAREIGGVSNVKRDRFGVVLQRAVVGNQIDARNGGVAEREVTVCIRAEPV